MSNSILELETDGTYDLDKIEVLNEFGGVEETKEEVPISYGVEESKEMSAPPLESAAKHTYDKGYARWERFDVETELKKEEASPRPAAKKKKKTTPTKNKEEKQDEIDFSLPMFEKLQASQKDGIYAILKLDEKAIDSLPEEQRNTVRAYRKMYQDQKALKIRGPMPDAPQEKKSETENERLLKDLQRLKLMRPDEANKRWEQVQSQDKQRELECQQREQQLRQKRVGTALSNLPKASQDIDVRLQGAADLHRKRNSGNKNKALEKKKQLAAIRRLATSSSSSLVDSII